MNVNWLDLLIGGVLVISLAGAVRNGVTREVIRIAALLLGVIAAMWWYDRAALALMPYVHEPRMAAACGFLLILGGCLTAGVLVAWVLIKIWGWTGLRWFDRLLGAGFGMIRGLLISAALLMAIVAFSPFPGTSATVAESKLAPWVLHGARAAAAIAPADFRDAFSEGFERVQGVWTGNRT